MDDEALLKLCSEDVVALSRKLMAQWHDSFESLCKLQGTTQTSILRVCSSAPEIRTWKSQGIVTLIGNLFLDTRLVPYHFIFLLVDLRFSLSL